MCYNTLIPNLYLRKLFMDLLNTNVNNNKAANKDIRLFDSFSRCLCLKASQQNR